MKKLFNHIVRWNSWRKYNTNAWLYKILVLLGICRSPTFMYWHDITEGYNRIVERTQVGKVVLKVKDTWNVSDESCAEVEIIKEDNNDTTETV